MRGSLAAFAASQEASVLLPGCGVGVDVARGPTPEPSWVETARLGGSWQVLSMAASASCSSRVTVSFQVILTVVQSVAYWRQEDRFSSHESPGPRAPFQRLVLAVMAMRCANPPGGFGVVAVAMWWQRARPVGDVAPKMACSGWGAGSELPV